MRSDEDRTADPITKTFERTFVKVTFDEDPSHEGDLSWLSNPDGGAQLFERDP